MDGDAKDKADLLGRLRTIEGQVRGVAQIIEQDRYCIDVLTQVAAITKALQGVSVGLFDDHSRRCVAAAVAAGVVTRNGGRPRPAPPCNAC